MGIRPTDLVHPPPDVEAVRRVDPDSEAQEFGQKERDGRKGGRRGSGREVTAEQDRVEVSAEYRAAEEEEQKRPLAPASPSTASGAPPKRHLDIQA